MNPRTKSRIGGALYDFMAYLTTREGSYTYGSGYECATDLLNHFTDWAYERGLSPMPSEPDVQHWNLGEGMIDVFLEFYGTGRLPTPAPGASKVSTAGPTYEPPPTVTKKRKWKDGEPEYEYFGLAGMPGGVRDDPESPNSYGDFPGNDMI